MAANTLPSVSWYVDPAALDRGEPGIYFSYLAALASALQARGEMVDPVWLLGASGWAFRIIVEKALCPSAMSIFDWAGILPGGVHNAGWDCTYVGRLWHEEDARAQRRDEAHAAICAGIDGGTPAVVWDLLLPEWGLITGYDEGVASYDVLAWADLPHDTDASRRTTGRGPGATQRPGVRAGQTPYDALGEREIRILSVTVPGARNERPREVSVRNALEGAVRHAEQGEWMDRPDYQDGLPAYEHWAKAITSLDANWDYAAYYAGHWAGARCYARDFLRGYCGNRPELLPAANAYASVASRMLDVWRVFSATSHPSPSKCQELADELREAGQYEREAVAAIKKHLAAS